MQVTGANPALNRGAVKAKPDQLSSCDHPVLPTGKPRDCLPAGRWLGFVAFSATDPHHLESVAAGV
jgi:hypothetical protein